MALLSTRSSKRSDDRVGGAGTAGHHGDAGFAGQPAPGVGHVHGGGFVAHVHEIEPGLQRRVEQRHDVVAGEREHVLAAEALERARDNIRAS
jgi:hypothetical protein